MSFWSNSFLEIREQEHKYIKEFEKQVNAEDSGETCDESVLDKIDTNIEKLEAALASIGKEQDYITGKRKKNSDTLNNDIFHRFDN